MFNLDSPYTAIPTSREFFDPASSRVLTATTVETITANAYFPAQEVAGIRKLEKDTLPAFLERLIVISRGIACDVLFPASEAVSQNLWVTKNHGGER